MKNSNPSGVFHGIHDVGIEQLERPEVTPNGVIIKVYNTGICGTDLHIYNEAIAPKGSVIGHEFSGEVAEIGDKVTDFSIGERVVINPFYKGIGLGVNPGGFSYVVKIDNVVKNQDVFSIPDSISNKRGAMIEPLAVGIAAINKTKISPTDTVLVTGAGTIGLVTVAGLKAKGIKNIVVSDISDFNLEVAKKLGASHTHNPLVDGSLTDYITKLCGKVPGLDYTSEFPNLQVAFECTGVGSVFLESINCLAPDATMVPIGIYSKKVDFDPNMIVYKRLYLSGSLFYTPEDFQEAIDLTASGAIDLMPILTHEFPLSQIKEAFEMAANGKNRIKVMVHPD